MTRHNQDFESKQQWGIEVKWFDIFILMLKYKWLIMAMIFAVGAIPIILNITIVNLPSTQHTSISFYKARCAILPVDNNAEILMRTLTSGTLKNSIIKNEGFVKVVGNTYWDIYNLSWYTKSNLTKEDIVTLLDSKFMVGRERDLIILSITHPNPKTAQDILTYYILELEKHCNEKWQEDKRRRLRDINEYVKNMSKEWDNNIRLRNPMGSHIAEALSKKNKIELETFTAFEVIDPPAVPPVAPQLIPKTKKLFGFRVILVLVMFTFIASIFLVFFIEFLKRLMKENSDKMAIIKEHLKL